MWKTMSAIFAVTMIAGALSLFHGSDVKASALAALSAKSDHADLQPNCNQHSWPYYQTSCLRDDTRNAGRVLKVRVVSTDRVPQANPNTDPDLAPYWPGMIADLQYVNPGLNRGTK